MKNIDFKKGLGFGALVWAIMFVVVSIFVAYGTPSEGPMSTTASIIVTLISFVAVYFAANYIAPSNYTLAMQYGLVFAIVGIILDFFISKKFAPDIFNSIYYWISYALIVFIPMLVVNKNSK